MNYSPLRYPGGKNKLAPFIAKICIENNITEHYIEPYCGGAGVALFLLLEGFIKRITINDKDRSIYSFWYSVLNHTEELIEKIKTTPITIEEWDNQREIQKNKESQSLLNLGFSTFFLNRTNRSGIINGGMIGGREQNSEYKIYCRFNKEELIERIKKITEKKELIELSNEDASILLDKVCLTQKTSQLIYLDPPYYKKADSLYLNYYKQSDHLEISQKIINSKIINWIVSYDNEPEINALYSKVEKIEYSFKHSAYNSRQGEEVLFFSPNINISIFSEKNPVHYKVRRNKTSSKIKYKQITDKVSAL